MHPLFEILITFPEKFSSLSRTVQIKLQINFVTDVFPEEMHGIEFIQHLFH